MLQCGSASWLYMALAFGSSVPLKKLKPRAASADKQQVSIALKASGANTLSDTLSCFLCVASGTGVNGLFSVD
jgi:hypothetical protein